MKKENISYDNIKDFKPGQSIYLQQSTGGGCNQIFLCEFIKIDKGVVHAKAISTDTNPQLYEYRLNDGWEMSARFEKCCLFGANTNEKQPHYHWFDANGYALYKNIEKLGEMVPKIHESYGTIALTRSQSNKSKSLFGSSIKHSNTISLKINKAEIDRNLNHDSIFSRETIVEVEMSETQFAQAITMFNRGEGTPVTLHYVNGVRMEECPYVSKVEQFSKEFNQDMQQLDHDLQAEMDKVTEILSSSKPISKGERELILKSMKGLTRTISDKLPYVAKSFNEQMDKTVTEAKKEIETFMQIKAKELGLDTNNIPLQID